MIWVAVAIFALGFGFIAARSFFIDTLASGLDMSDPSAGAFIDSLMEAAPNNPKVHLLAAVYYEKTFDVADLDRSLSEYEQAAELDPSDHNLWLAVAQARDRIGDANGAETAFKRSLDLAPNYADIQWAYGNFLFRQGREEEGFTLIAKAASGDPALAGPAISIVTQITGGDLAKIHGLLGNDPIMNAALTQTLIAERRYDDALRTWSTIPVDIRHEKYWEVGQVLLSGLLYAHVFRAAAIVAADQSNGDPIVPGQVSNGDFENNIKLRNAGPFDWQITEGSEPQIGLNEAQKHGGQYSLAMLFNTFKSLGYRNIAQLIAVEPGAHYRLQIWYKSNLKTGAKFAWQIIDAATNKVLASTPELTPTDNWTPVSADIAVPSDSDGVKLVLVRWGCTSVACPATGTLAFDDIALVKE